MYLYNGVSLCEGDTIIIKLSNVLSDIMFLYDGVSLLKGDTIYVYMMVSPFGTETHHNVFL